MAVAIDGNDSKDITELFNLLESNDLQVVTEIKQLIQENLSSTRESWLLNSLLDYYYVSQSERAMEILACVRQPHDKHLFDKLNEGLKHTESKLLTLRFLLFTIFKQPSWIHKLIKSSVFNNIIRCLKNDTDIPTLMTAVLIIASYLPIDPLSMATHLKEIFDVFTRLLSFNKKKPGNIPDIFLLHLQVSVYALFHRLYGMFPCNFLAYLRSYFASREHQEACLDLLKPMLERVRLHPLLITGSKDYESTQQRWRKMEIQDIVVECAKMSLDAIEGTWEEVRCPILAPQLRLYSDMSSKPPSTSVTPISMADPDPYNLPVYSHGENVLPNTDPSHHPYSYVTGFDAFPLWSPSTLCGLSTPPPSSASTHHHGNPDNTSSLQHSHPGTSYTNTPLLTPLQTPRESPHVDDLFDRTRNSRSNLSKRLSAGSLSSPKLHVSTNTMAQTSFDSQTSLSVPPSPLRPEFTSEPPAGTHRTHPLPRTAQKLPFDEAEKYSTVMDGNFSYNLVNKLDSPLVEKFQSLSCETISESFESSETENTVIEGKPKSNSDPPDLVSDERTRSMSIKVVDKVVQEMAEEIYTGDGTDEEVREIIQDETTGKLSRSESSDQINNNLQLTAESVQQFMKKVNRIRFNSLTIGNHKDAISDTVPKGGRRMRSRSCPQPVSETEDEYDPSEQFLRCSSAALRQHSDSHSQNVSQPERNSIPPATTDSIATSVPTIIPPSLDNNHVYAVSVDNNRPAPEDLDTNRNVLNQADIEDNDEMEQILPKPFDRIMQYSLPYSAITRCQQCKRRYVTARDSTNLRSDGVPVAAYETPLFSTFSPPELLDRHLHLGGEVHAKELSRIPMTSQDTINWTHFGGLPPADEVSILRSQILLIQNQLMYERHKRELHAKRNRRLLSKITHAKSLEERNSALLDQLRLQENEIQSLQVSVKLLQQENQHLKGTQESNCAQQKEQLSNTVKENEGMKYQVSQLESQVETLKVEKAEAIKMLQQSEFRVFDTERELVNLQGQVAMAKNLQDQIARLNKELLLMGELQQKYKEQLAVQINKQPNAPETAGIIPLKSEIKALKQQAEQKESQVGYMQKKMMEFDHQSKHKDITIKDLKKSLEIVKSNHVEEVKAVESKYQAAMKITQQYESHVMELYGQIETLKRANRQRGSVKVPSEASLGGQGRDSPALGSSPSYAPFGATSETLAAASSGEMSDPYNSQPLQTWSSSPPVLRSHSDTSPYTALSHQLSTGSLGCPGGLASLMSQSDAFSSAGPMLNQSTDRDKESAPAQAIVLETRHSNVAHDTNVANQTDSINSDQTLQTQDSLDLESDADRRSTSSRSNTLCDSGVETR